ncbi:Mut7-C ubiquitin/RNAse domain-containing protein [Cellulomonas chengniuliangii]|uniref:Mut7-C ubiquitin/RNAse domain-containing protein n=1 Tax=Cellulomonas chengniuliangii TaxID=2968084 RepID=A0ABY5KY42_9CELL|nr:Mut7-C ubiquitin/RNAse domain-containing protein [Cellulomonas chengniuliangii]MCC2309802.1 Mut7-C ubiquitin/RNAse domain-containing protein [Cellulomonas chengniuliangii]MCC2319094.1 Mut7-C ubiquitin/RNAse domain-containing protein [Cellulomonas chengniuliangii]UUI74655.1 Mut7-C ubiquitin/RNAse domain-containing protein [Cellulomonas chengniuliangii]
MRVVRLRIDPALRFLLTPRHRGEGFTAGAADTDTWGHVVESVGVPLTEVGALTVDGATVAASARADDGVLRVEPVRRPQATGSSPPRFLLDVHLGSLTRRLRLLGLDAAYRPEADDPALARIAAAEGRVLLTQDRGLLRRRSLPHGALVRGSSADEQLDDVLDRFAPPLAPWTRCTACGGVLALVAALDVAAEVREGTARSYRDFGRCVDCGHVYWRGAHAARIEPVVARARDVVARRRLPARDGEGPAARGSHGRDGGPDERDG